MVMEYAMFKRKWNPQYMVNVREDKHGVFTPLVLSTTGSFGSEATTFYKRLADLISSK